MKSGLISLTTVSLSCLFVLAVFTAFTSADKAEDGDCPATCTQDTECGLISMARGTFTLMLKLDENGVPTGMGRRHRQNPDTSDDSSGRKKRDADNDKRRGGKPGGEGGRKPDGDRERPLRGPGEKRKEKRGKVCFPGKGLALGRIRKGKKVGKPFIAKILRANLITSYGSSLMMKDPVIEQPQCGVNVTDLKDSDTGAAVSTSVYKIVYTFTHTDIVTLTAKLSFMIYVFQENATIEGQMVIPCDSKWRVQAETECADIPGSNYTCADFMDAEYEMLMQNGGKNSKSCEDNCGSELRGPGGARATFPTKAKVDNVDRPVKFTYMGNLNYLRMRKGQNIIIDPVVKVSYEVATEAEDLKEIDVGPQNEAEGSGVDGHLTKGVSMTTVAAMFVFWMLRKMDY